VIKKKKNNEDVSTNDGLSLQNSDARGLSRNSALKIPLTVK
jgi:hypothetical protein